MGYKSRRFWTNIDHYIKRLTRILMLVGLVVGILYTLALLAFLSAVAFAAFQGEIDWR